MVTNKYITKIVSVLMALAAQMTMKPERAVPAAKHLKWVNSRREKCRMA